MTSDGVLAICIASRNRLRLAPVFGAILADLRSVLGAKMGFKIDFLDVFLRGFFRMRYCIDLGSFLGGSKREQNLGKHNDFYKIDVFEKLAKHV